MAQPVAVRNVLTALDESPPTSFHWQLTLLATLGGFLFGYDTSDIGSALNFIPYGLHGLALGYLVSGASLGAAAGAILAGPTADRFGRVLVPPRDQEPASRGDRPCIRTEERDHGTRHLPSGSEGMIMEPTAAGHETIDHGESHVHRWRVSQLKRLGIPGSLAEVYADHLDWHLIARLVQRGCPPRLALRIVR